VLERRLAGQVKLLFGWNTMTVNRQPRGRLLRIKKAPNTISDLDPVISRELAELLHRHCIYAALHIVQQTWDRWL
jgi:hypothetical protein